MPTLTVAISEELLEKVESRASAYGRSVQDEVILCLYDATIENPRSRRELTLEEAAELEREIRLRRERMPMMDIDNDELNRYKREGRL